MDPRTPVIVGASQVENRTNHGEPIKMMVEATTSALADAGISGSKLDAVRVVRGIWPYHDPGRLVADVVGATSATTSITPIGGNEAYELVNNTAAKIQRGELDVAVVCAAENLRTRRGDHAAGRKSQYINERDGVAADEITGADKPMFSEAEQRAGLLSAVNFYALAETAIRHRQAESIEAHRARVSSLWARASAVAAANPHGWSRTAQTAEQIAIPSPSNRLISHPYPKLMTSNIDVDQGSSVVMVSAAFADAAGIARDRWVFPYSGAMAHDHWFPTNRWALDESPAMRIAGNRALQLAGLTVDDCQLIDLYSCFPAAVQVAQRELGIDPAREFTLTGGLTFAGGPLNCYCLQALARTVELIREQPRNRAFITGNGGFFTKHSFTVLGGQPPNAEFVAENVQAEVDAQPSRRAADPSDPSSVNSVVEAYTVTYDREGDASRATLSCLNAQGERWWATSTDRDVCGNLTDSDRCGITVDPDVRSGDLAGEVGVKFR